MDWLKSLFGDDEKNSPQKEQTDDYPAQMIPLEELEMLQGFDEAMAQLESTVQPNVASQPKDTAKPNEKKQPQGITQPSGVNQPKGTAQPNGVNQPKGTAQLNGVNQPKGTVQPNGANKPKGVAKTNGVIQPKGFNKPFTPKIFEEDTKLTIILVENTEEVAKEKDKLEKLVKSLVTTGYVAVINYGKVVREGKATEAKKFDCSELLYVEFAGDNACLYDALIVLESIVEKNYKKTEDLKYKRIKIKSIDVIGIGTCLDNCSISSSQIAMESFARVAKYTDVNTKYFCLSEDSFIKAATIGFHSIGSIARNYM